MSYYNLCGIRSQHSDISKGKRGGGGTYINKITGVQNLVKIDRNKYLTLNRCPLGNYE
jgi:hypothetical protein